jgi:hypothetical protein
VLAETPVPDDAHSSYETVVCQACSELHFIHRSTGKLLGAKDRSPAAGSAAAQTTDTF